MAAESIQILLAATKQALGEKFGEALGGGHGVKKETNSRDDDIKMSMMARANNTSGTLSYQEFKDRFVKPREKKEKEEQEKQFQKAFEQKKQSVTTNIFKNAGDKALLSALEIQALLRQSLSPQLSVANKIKTPSKKGKKKNIKKNKSGNR